MEYRVLLGSSGVFRELGNIRDGIGKILANPRPPKSSRGIRKLSGPLKIP
jgi:hypothetical protein